jgi:hypothetical protein
MRSGPSGFKVVVLVIQPLTTSSGAACRPFLSCGASEAIRR